MAIYLPPDDEKMWDTWLFQDGDVFHLFFLSEGKIGRAVSGDLIHWKHMPPISIQTNAGDWDEKGMRITGFTVKCKDQYLLSYGPGSGKPIGILTSMDLHEWERYPANPVLLPGGPYSANEWRDLSSCYDPDKKIWHGYVCADQEKAPCIAHLTSPDYFHWDYHDPVFASEDFVEYEVPEYFTLGDKHYLLFSSLRSRKDTSGRQDAGGTWYVVSDQRNGPYHLPQNPLLLGFGRGRNDHYVGRIIDFHGQPLLYHQTFGEGRPIVWGFPKAVRQINHEEIKLYFWENLCVLKDSILHEQSSLSCSSAPGKINLKMLNVHASDLMVTFSLDYGSVSEAGIVWHFAELRPKGPETNTESGVGLLINPGLDLISMVNVRRIRNFGSDTVICCLRDDFSGFGLSQGLLQVRILVRAHMAEIYLNDQWIFSMDISDVPRKGDMGILVKSGSAVIHDLCISSLKPLEVSNEL
ncbi:MAG TPA: hypothetical protein DD640_07405 [Clostridiales bacterium]|nr:hypothetical protein [Clostridiales bacterium]